MAFKRFTNSFKENLKLFQATTNSTEIDESENKNQINVDDKKINQIFDKILQSTNKYEGNSIIIFFVKFFNMLTRNFNRESDRSDLISKIKENFLNNMLKFNNQTDQQTPLNLVDIHINTLNFKITINKDQDNKYELSFAITNNEDNKNNQIQDEDINPIFEEANFNNLISNIADELYNKNKFSHDLLLYYLKDNSTTDSSKLRNKLIIKNLPTNSFNSESIQAIINAQDNNLIKSIFNRYDFNEIQNIDKLAAYILDKEGSYKDHIIKKSLEIILTISNYDINKLKQFEERIIKLIPDNPHVINLFEHIQDKTKYLQQLFQSNTQELFQSNNQESIKKIITHIILKNLVEI